MISMVSTQTCLLFYKLFPLQLMSKSRPHYFPLLFSVFFFSFTLLLPLFHLIFSFEVSLFSFSPLASLWSPFAIWVTNLFQGSGNERLVLFCMILPIPVGSCHWQLQCDLSACPTLEYRGVCLSHPRPHCLYSSWLWISHRICKRKFWDR